MPRNPRPVKKDLLLVFSEQAAAAGGVSSSSTLTSPTYVFCVPDVLSTGSAATDTIPWLPGAGYIVKQLLAQVKVAPTGASLIVEYFLGTLATGGGLSSIGTVTITAGNYTASTAIPSLTVGLATFMAIQINQVGSTIAGTGLTAIAR